VFEVLADGVGWFPGDEGGGDGGGEAAAGLVVFGVEEDVAFFGAAVVFAAEADAEGVVEVVGGVERVLSFEDGAADAGESAGDAIDVGVGRAVVAIGRKIFEDRFAVGGISSEAPEVVHAERMPLALVLWSLFVERVGDVVADGGEVRVAAGADDNGMSELGPGWFVQPVDELARGAVYGVHGIHGNI
jgi:hypothetical protein